MRGKAEQRPDTGRRAATLGSEELALSRNVLRLVRGDWLEGEWTAEAKRFVPSLLVGVYLADLEGRRLSKREASTLMNADPATSGPKYISMCEERGLISIERKPAADKRKDFVRPTGRLRAIVDRQLEQLIQAVLEREREEVPGAHTPFVQEPQPSHGRRLGHMVREDYPEMKRLKRASASERRDDFFGAMDGYLNALKLQPDLEAAREGLMRLAKSYPGDAERYYKERLEEFGIVIPGGKRQSVKD